MFTVLWKGSRKNIPVRHTGTRTYTDELLDKVAERRNEEGAVREEDKDAFAKPLFTSNDS